MKKNKIKVKKNKNPLLKVTVIAIVLCLFSTVAYAINQAVNNDPVNSSVEVQKEVKPDIKKSKPIETYEDSAKADEQAFAEKTKKLDPQKVVELYKQGYSYQDIEYAEHLSVISEISPEEILKAKGKTEYVVTEGAEGKPAIRSNSRPWEEVVKQFNIELTPATEKAGMTKEDMEALKAIGLSDEEVAEAGLLAFNNKKTHKEVLAELKAGKNLETLKKQYWEENRPKKVENEVTEASLKFLEDTLKEKYKITEEDMQKARKYGISNISEIAMAKEIAQQRKTTYEKVMETRKAKGDWKKVEDTLEVKGNEK